MWGEHLDYEDYEKIYPRLSELDVELFLAVKEGNFPSHDVFQKMDFRVWLLLSEEKGYWLSVWNAEEFLRVLQSFISEYGDDTEWIILDIEIPIYFAEKLSRDFLSALSEVIPPDDVYERGKMYMSSITSFVKENGMKVLCVAPPFLLDDLIDGDDDIQRLLGIYLPSGCDEYSFMVYTTILPTFIKGEIDNPEYFVWIYGKLAREFFGENTALDVGLVGEDSFGNMGYSSPDELIRDISAGISAGVKDFHIWSVDNMMIKERSIRMDNSGVLRNQAWERWIPWYIEPKEPQKSKKIEALRQIFLSID